MPGGTGLFIKSATGEDARAVADEIARLAWLQGRLPTARLIAEHRSADAAWLVTEPLAGRTAAEALADDPDASVRIIPDIAAFLKALHALPVEDCPFMAGVAAWLPLARRRVAMGAVDTDDFDEERAGWSAAAVLALVERLADRACGAVIVHGDMTLDNILVDADGRVAGCIDVGRLGVGDPYQDIALLARDLGEFGAEQVRVFLEAAGAWPPDDERLLLHRALDELF